ncbi:MAG TPA: serine hydrolase [Propionibacteriaceae bacterium]|nr:serine hydrolase [Propionibacteriaceae bacterium]
MRFKTGLLGAVVPALMAILVTLLLAPTPAPVGYRSAGDAVLVNRVRALVAGPEARASGSDQGFRSLAVGVVDGPTSSYAFIGDRGDGSPPDASSTFELASVTKTFTALMLRDQGRGAPVGSGGAIPA